MSRMICPRCKGDSFIKRGDRLVVCPICHGKGTVAGVPGLNAGFRTGAGPHGGTAKQKNRRERKRAKRDIREE